MPTDQKCSLLIVDDEPFILATLTAFLPQDFEILTTESGEAAQRVFDQRSVDLILTDQRMPGMSGVQLLEWVRQHSPKTIRLLMTAFAELEDALEAINRGKVHRYLFKPWHADELLQTLREAARIFNLERQNEQLLQELSQLNAELEQRVQQRTCELEEANHELERTTRMLDELALTDPLTGLPNRRAVDQLADKEIRRRDRVPQPLALGFIDVDYFKEINTAHHLPGGDQVLVDVAKVLCDSVRGSDTAGRYGGDEFIVLAPGTGPEGAIILGERIRSAVESYPFEYKGQRIHVTVSIGFVAAVGMTVSFEQLKEIAAAALAEAKANGRNRCVVRSLP